MNGGEMMVIVIVAIGMFGGVMKARYRGTAARDDAAPAQDAAESYRLREEVRSLKERIAVLERLATDNNDSGARLDREIERLRDRP